MTIYIAVCDDNIADRKHIERLLEREKDARLKVNGDVLYIESFGSSEALLKTPVKYDMFIVDITESSLHGMEVAKTLRSKGIIAPITLFSSKIDYKLFSNEPEQILHLDKPATQGQISHIVDMADNWSRSKPQLIEIHGKLETVFLPHVELVRAVQRSGYTEISTADGKYIEMPVSLKHFKRDLSSFDCFIPCKKSVVNIHHIVGRDGKVLTLSNNEHYKIPVFSVQRLLAIFIKYVIKHNTGEYK